MGEKKRKESRSGFVYSTDPGWKPAQEAEEVITLEPKEQKLRIRLDTKRRAGKAVTLVEGFVGKDVDLAELGKRLKAYCGTGGSAKEGIIMIQGAVSDKIKLCLQQWGYKIAKG